MKRISPLIFLFVTIGLSLVLISGCITVNLGNTAPTPDSDLPTQPAPTVETAEPTPPQAGLTEDTLFNMQYLSPMLQVPVQLVNGEFSGVVDGVELTAKVRPEIVFGDLNHDGVNDAALLLSENTGGSGIFVSLFVVYSKGDRFKQAPAVMIDDRPIIDQVAVENGMVRLTGLIHGPNDPMVNPTTSFSAEYKLFGERLVQTRFESAFEGGEWHAINIESPDDQEEFSGSVRLVGNMPIGPFENNLSLTITDPAGNVEQREYNHAIKALLTRRVEPDGDAWVFAEGCA